MGLTWDQRLERDGVAFGEVVVAVDPATEDTLLRVTVPGKIAPVPKTLHFSNIEQLRGVYGAHEKAANSGNEQSQNIRRAMKFAGDKINEYQARKKR